MQSVSDLVLVSGGMDSAVLLAKVVTEQGQANVGAITFDYGQRHNREVGHAVKIVNAYGLWHTIVQLPDHVFGKSSLTGGKDAITVPHGHFEDPAQSATVVPCRNLVFLSIAAAKAQDWGARRVWFAAHAGDRAIYLDCRPEFIDVVNACFAAAVVEATVCAPFLGMSKRDIVRMGRSLPVPQFLMFAWTWSCYEGGEQPCGKCGACMERIWAEGDE